MRECMFIRLNPNELTLKCVRRVTCMIDARSAYVQCMCFSRLLRSWLCLVVFIVYSYFVLHARGGNTVMSRCVCLPFWVSVLPCFCLSWHCVIFFFQWCMVKMVDYLWNFLPSSVLWDLCFVTLTSSSPSSSPIILLSSSSSSSSPANSLAHLNT